jgi:hypothetical protein
VIQGRYFSFPRSYADQFGWCGFPFTLVKVKSSSKMRLSVAARCS